jgi:predicted nucleotidyltransferase
MSRMEIHEYKPELKEKLPETYDILKASKIAVNPRVKKITLHGSRGLKGKFRINSDLDLCLVTDIDIQLIPEQHWDILLRRVLKTTLDNSKCPVELDVSVVFDHMGCGLRCFSVEKYEDLKCHLDASGCMGVYKLQEGFKGFMPPITRVEKMYPYITIWER